MKRLHTSDGDGIDGLKEGGENKKTKMEDKESGRVLATAAVPMPTESVLLDENLLCEVLKHVDGRTLAWAACVSKLWKRTAQDERLWELMCLKDGSRNQQQQQLRNVVLALGGFRRLYSLHLWPLVKPSSSSSSTPASTWPCLPPPPKPLSAKFAAGKTRWGNDEMNLSLSLLSIRYYEKMNPSNRNKQT